MHVIKNKTENELLIIFYGNFKLESWTDRQQSTFKIRENQSLDWNKCCYDPQYSAIPTTLDHGNERDKLQRESLPFSRLR